MQKGVIVKIKTSYGFIQISDAEASVYFHISETDGKFSELKEGDSVEFETEQTQKGPQAKNLRKV